MNQRALKGIVAGIAFLPILMFGCGTSPQDRMSDDEMRNGFVQALDAALEMVQITQPTKHPIGGDDFDVNITPSPKGWLACVVFSKEAKRWKPTDTVDSKADDAKRRGFVQALDAALKAVAKNHPIGDCRFRVSISEYTDSGDKTGKPSDGWYVQVTFLPETPGAELGVMVERSGEVTVGGLLILQTML